MGVELIFNIGSTESKKSLEEELMVVYVQDYDDDYHRTDDQPSTELERKVRNLKRKYKNVTEYSKAMRIYDEYMDFLKDKYGDGKSFKIQKKLNLIPEKVPAKPKLKSTKFNRFVLKHGIAISESKISYQEICYNEDWYEDFIEKETQNISIKEVIEAEPEGKEYDKIIDIGMSSRIRNTARLNNRDLDYIEEYLGIKNINRKKKKKEKGYTITELLVNGDSDEFERDESLDNGIVEYAGRYFTKDTIEVINFYKSLEEYGWDPYKLMRKRNTAKGITKLFKEEKKKKKKKQKEVDGFMLNLATDGNAYVDSFEAYEREMLSFTSQQMKSKKEETWKW